MKVPIISVKTPLQLKPVKNMDISSDVEDFKFEHCVDMDNMVEITISNRSAIKFADSDWLKTGNLLYVQYGFLGGPISKVHTLEIFDVECYYNNDVTLLIRALDLGNQMKISKSQIIWKNLFPNDIVKTIAAKYNLQCVVDPEGPIIVSSEEPQGNKTDYEFLSYLATKYNKMLHVGNDTIYFVQRNLEQESTATFVYGNGTNVISFEYHLKDSTRDKDSTGALIAGVGTKDNEAATTTGDPGKGTKLGTYFKNQDSKPLVNLNLGLGKTVNSSINGAINSGIDSTIKRIIPTPNGDDEGAQESMADKVTQDAQLTAITATLKVEGSPKLVADKVITIQGVAKIHSGNWYISKATHNIKAGGAYITTLELRRNASAKPTSTSDSKAADQNNTKGPNNPSATNSIPFVNQNGQRQ